MTGVAEAESLTVTYREAASRGSAPRSLPTRECS
jgi:hypothetical protein